MQIKLELIAVIDDGLIVGLANLDDIGVGALIKDLKCNKLKLLVKTDDMQRFKDVKLSLDDLKEVWECIKEEA